MKQDFTVKIPPVAGYDSVALPKINYSSHFLSKMGAFIALLFSIFFGIFVLINYLFFSLDSKNFLKITGTTLDLNANFWFTTHDLLNLPQYIITFIVIAFLPIIFYVLGFASNRSSLIGAICLLILGSANIACFYWAAIGPCFAALLMLFGYALRKLSIRKQLKNNDEILNNLKRDSFLSDKSSGLLTSRASTGERSRTKTNFYLTSSAKTKNTKTKNTKTKNTKTKNTKPEKQQ